MQILVIVLILIVVLAAAYALLVRPRQLRWGSTPSEVRQTMPGDNIVSDPNFVATRAVTVNAPPDRIWPWLLQIGATRAGFYSHDWLDNGGKPSADHIIPELQTIAVGDFIPMTTDQKNGMWVESFVADEYILWWDKKSKATWLWLLAPIDAGHSRLITRLRTRYDLSFPWVIYYTLYDFGDIFMMRKCLEGIKQRAESLA